LSRYRNRLQIIAEILEIVKGGARKTHIMYRANLSYKLLCKYLNEVLECGLVRAKDDESYIVAAKGERFLQRFNSYLKHHKQVNKELQSVEEERAMLEQKYMNPSTSTSNRRNSGNKQVSME